MCIRSRPVLRFLLAFGCAAGSAAWTDQAVASESFPDVVRGEWNPPNGVLPVPGEGCRLCHNRDTGQTATNPDMNPYLGTRLRTGYGILQKRTGSLANALRQIEERREDNDRDSVPDYDEVATDRTSPSDPRSHRPFETPSDGGAGGEGPGAGGESSGGAPIIDDLPPPAPLPELPPPLQYGCSASTSRPHSGSTWLLFILLAPLALRRRSRMR
jgi:MYXO-CTERM domain-containing protein